MEPPMAVSWKGGVDDLLICASAEAPVPLLAPFGWAVLVSGLVHFGVQARRGGAYPAA
jgi:hypothetical protein